MSTKTAPAPTLRDTFLAAAGARPEQLTLEQWPTYASLQAGTDAHQFQPNTLPADEAEQQLVATMRDLALATPPLRDLREFSLVLKSLFPAEHYLVGAGGQHVYVVRLADQQRLAIICPKF
jgi:hypothetical protein